MGNCCIGVKTARSRMTQRKRRRKIVLLLVGLDKAGKTTAAKGLVGEESSDTVPTVGFSTFIQTYKGYSVIIYDLGGGPQIRGIWNKYFIDVHGIIYVVDASDTNRIDESRLVLQELLTHDKLAGKPLLLLANKQDCEGAMDEIDVVERLKLESIVNQQKCPTLVETCSALISKTGSNRSQIDPGIQNGYRWLLSIIIKEFKQIDARVDADTEMARIQLEVEKRDRKMRVEERRREREELEGTVIIPLRDDDLPDDSKIIQVQTLSVESEDPTVGATFADTKVHTLSDSHDSGCTLQNVEDFDDMESEKSVVSQDSAVQSIAAKETGKPIEDLNELVSTSSYSDINKEIIENQPRPSKCSKFVKHNKTAPAPAGVFLHGNDDSQSTSSGHQRHKLPPLTPPLSRTKMFQARSAKSVRLLKSLSLSSDDSDEISPTSKAPFLSNSQVTSKGAVKSHQPNGFVTGSAEVHAVMPRCNDKNSLNSPISETIILADNLNEQNNIIDVFTVKSSNSTKYF